MQHTIVINKLTETALSCGQVMFKVKKEGRDFMAGDTLRFFLNDGANSKYVKDGYEIVSVLPEMSFNGRSIKTGSDCVVLVIRRIKVHKA